MTVEELAEDMERQMRELTYRIDRLAQDVSDCKNTISALPGKHRDLEGRISTIEFELRSHKGQSRHGIGY